MTKEQFETITKWQKETFTDATVESKIAHLLQELEEVKEDGKLMTRGLEFSDCFFLLFGAAAVAGMNYDMICAAIQYKFEINKARKWGKPDADGVVNHIKE